jgi:hypothetical protein
MPARLCKCSACDRAISETATVCPGCGTPGELAQQPKSTSKTASPEIADPIAAETPAAPKRLFGWKQVVGLDILSLIFFVVLLEVFGVPNKPTQDTSQAPPAATRVAPATTSSPPSAAPLSTNEYRDAILQETKELGQSLHRLETLSWHSQDDSWRNAMEVEFALWQADYERAQKRVPPPQLAEADAKYVYALWLLADAGKKFVHGIDDYSPPEIEAGTKELKEYHAQLKEALSSGLLSDAEK